MPVFGNHFAQRLNLNPIKYKKLSNEVHITELFELSLLDNNYNKAKLIYLSPTRDLAKCQAMIG